MTAYLPFVRRIAQRLARRLPSHVVLEDLISAGVVGLLICGFMLWGYPSSAYEGYAAINPVGMAIGAVIMFGLLGFLPGWIIASILNSAGKLRIPREAELAGLDYNLMEASKRDQDSHAAAEQ